MKTTTINPTHNLTALCEILTLLPGMFRHDFRIMEESTGVTWTMQYNGPPRVTFDFEPIIIALRINGFTVNLLRTHCNFLVISIPS